MALKADMLPSLLSPNSTSKAAPYQRSDSELGGKSRLVPPENDMIRMITTGSAATSKPSPASVPMTQRNDPRPA